MGIRVFMVVVFCSMGLLATGTEKDKRIARKDSLEKQAIKGDSVTKIILDDDKKGKVRLDDTLVFDDQEAPKGNQKGFVLNKKTGEGFKQNSMIIDPEDDQEEFYAEPKTFDLPERGTELPVEVFPNPSVALRATHLILPYPASWEITITHINGQSTTQRLTTENTTLLLEIAVEGAYIVKAVEGNTILYKRLIVQ